MQVLCGSRIIWSDIHLANKPWTRLRGLLGRASLEKDEGLLIVPCNQVHMFFMKFALDLIFMDRQNQVVHLVTLKPGQISPLVHDAYSVLEVGAGSASEKQISIGDQLTII